jgi:hypothetical protein
MPRSLVDTCQMVLVREVMLLNLGCDESEGDGTVIL